MLLGRSDNAMSRGLEDVRLFAAATVISHPSCKELGEGGSNRVRILGCTVDLTEDGTPNCFVGGLDLETGVVDDVCVMTSRKTQKNWIPVPTYPSDDLVPFLYSWNRSSITWGVMRPGWNTDARGPAPLWEMTEWTEHGCPFLQQAKGSSCFVPYDEEGLHIGVVHATQEVEGEALRRYWHFFVVMDFVNKEVVRVSRPWTLGSEGVQYCIGYWFSEGVHHVWGSVLDKDPVYLRISDVEWV